MKKPKSKPVPSTDVMYKADVKSVSKPASKSYDPSHHLGAFLHPKKAKGRKK